MSERLREERKPMKAVVTTDSSRRGVFHGQVVEYDIVHGTCVLKDAQMAVFWSAESRGVLGLASIGPQAGSRITPIVPRIELNGVTAVIEATPTASAAWESQPWT